MRAKDSLFVVAAVLFAHGCGGAGPAMERSTSQANPSGPASSGGSGGPSGDGTVDLGSASSPRDGGAIESGDADAGATLGQSCSGSDPTMGFTEYPDTFDVQHPYNLTQADRYSFQDGIYSTWVHNTDLPFKDGSGTGPRTEMRWSQSWTAGERMWEADVMVDPPTTHSAIMQVKSNDGGREAIYLQIDDGHLQNSVGPVIAKDVVGHWFHLNVAYNATTRVGRVWMNNCLIFTTTHATDATWYFKNGVYGCDPVTCESHFKNVHVYKK
jgi:hypothetical protein